MRYAQVEWYRGSCVCHALGVHKPQFAVIESLSCSGSAPEFRLRAEAPHYLPLRSYSSSPDHQSSDVRKASGVCPASRSSRRLRERWRLASRCPLASHSRGAW